MLRNGLGFETALDISASPGVKMPRVLMATAGTRLQDAGKKRGIEDFHHPSFYLEEGDRANWPVFERFVEADIDAGASLLVTPTYGASRWLLDGEHNDVWSGEKFKSLVKKVVAGFVDIRTKKGVSAGLNFSLGSVGVPYEGDETFASEEAEREYRYLFQVFKDLNLDSARILVEALSEPEDIRAALKTLIKMQIPGVLAFAIDPDGKIYNGDSVEETLRSLSSEKGFDASAISFAINCSVYGAIKDVVLNLPENLLKLLSLIYPNASDRPVKELDSCGETCSGDYDLAERSEDLVNLGLSAGVDVGFCCGSTTEHVAAIKRAIDKATSYK